MSSPGTRLHSGPNNRQLQFSAPRHSRRHYIPENGGLASMKEACTNRSATIASDAVTVAKPLLLRLWMYQKERFPLHKHGLLVAAFTFAGMSLSAALRGELAVPHAVAYAACLATTLTTFLQLRIADEHKDQKEDALYRPYLPVPRGLVSLAELRVVFVATVVLQVGVNVMFSPSLLTLLSVIWVYLFFMSKEFFASQWLRKHPVAYLLSHMTILPLIDAYITACDWLPAHSAPPVGLIPFLLLSFFNGLVLEIGRKIRSPHEEEPGVETYSILWGPRPSVTVWCAAIATAAMFATLTAAASGGLIVVSVAAVLLICCVRSLAKRVASGQLKHCANRMETLSASWLLVIYLCLGLSPFLRLAG